MSPKQALFHAVRCHFLALLVVVLATLVRIVLLPGLGTHSPFITFYPAIILAALYAGFSAGLFAIALSVLIAVYLWIEPVNQFAIRDPADWLTLLVFLVNSVAVAAICRARHTLALRARNAEMQAIRAEERARAVEALRASDERLRLFVENVPAAVAMLDNNLHYLAVSQRWLADYRLPDRDVIGRHAYDVFPEFPEAWKLVNARCLAGTSEKIPEQPFKRADGSIDFVRREIHPWRDSNGKIGGLMIFSEIVTEAKRAQQLLTTRMAALDAAADGVVITNPQGIIEYVNPAFTTTTGYSAAEVLGKNPRILKSGLHDQPFYQDLWQTILAGQVWRGELINRRKNGTLYREEMTITPVLSDDSQILSFIAIKRDVTERKRFQDQLDETRRRLTGIIESAMDAIITVDENHRIILFNPAAEKMFRCPADQALQSPVDRFIPQRFQHAHTSHIQTFSDTGQTGRAMGKLGTIFGLRADGQEFPIEASISQVTVDGRKLFSVILRDVTERQQTEAQLRNAIETAETANRTKDQFLAMLSHELRTPLTPALMLLSSQEHNPALPDEVRQDLTTIRHNIELETRIIDDLLDLSRIASGKMRLHLEPFSLTKILRRAIAICLPDIQAKQLNLHQDFSATHDAVQADPARLLQVFWNLLKNAVKFTPQGGNLFVGSSNASPDRIEIQVQDSGIGISPDALTRIFGAFEQADGQISRKFGGLGLGLAISKAIVDLHAGSISATSQGSQHGALFTVAIPLTHAAPTPIAAPPVTTPTTSLRLLLVEDHPDTAKTLARLLRASGHYVQTAATIAQALSALQLESFDLLLSDLGLPDGSGHDLMQHAKARYSITGICMSGYGMESDIEKSRHAGFATHLTKPISFPQLQAAIQQFSP